MSQYRISSPRYLKLQFEAVSRSPEEEKRIVKARLEGMILKHEAQRWTNA